MSFVLKGTKEKVYIKRPGIVDKALKHVGGRKKTVIQAGAHVGVWPHRLAQDFDLVVAFEPMIDSWNVAVQSARADNVFIIHGALGTRHDVLSVVGAKYSGSAKVSGEGNYPPIPVYAIDALPRCILENLDAIFLDVEGYEIEILRGAVDAIHHRLPLIVVEDEGIWKRSDLLDLLPSSYTIVEEYRRDLILKSADT